MNHPCSVVDGRQMDSFETLSQQPRGSRGTALEQLSEKNDIFPNGSASAWVSARAREHRSAGVPGVRLVAIAMGQSDQVPGIENSG